MAIFDFSDLANSGFSQVGDSATQIMSQYRQGMKDALESEMALKKLEQVDQRLGIDALELQQKMEDRPLERLINAQKVNLLPPKPTQDDLMAAANEYFQGKDPKTLNLTPEARAKAVRDIERMAEEMARSRVPRLDPNDPSAWMDYAAEHQLSDADLDLRKAEGRFDLEVFKEEGRRKRQQEQLESTMERVGLQIGAREDIANKNLASRERIAAENRAAANERQIANQGKQVLQKIAEDLQGYGSFKAPRARKRLQSYHEKLKTFARNNPGSLAAKNTLEEFESTYLSNLNNTSMPSPRFGVGTQRERPKYDYVLDGSRRSFPEGSRVFVPGKGIYTVKNGRLKR